MTTMMLRLLLAFLVSIAAASSASAQRRDSTRAKVNAATPACCLVVRVDAKDTLVTARETATGFTFRFAVKDRRMLASIKVGDPLWADFAGKTVKLKGTDATSCCAIVETVPTGTSTPPDTPEPHR